MPSAVRVNNKWDRQHGRKVPFLHFDGSFTTKITPKVAAISGQNNGSFLKLTTLNAGYTRVHSLASKITCP